MGEVLPPEICALRNAQKRLEIICLEDADSANRLLRSKWQVLADPTNLGAEEQIYDQIRTPKQPLNQPFQTAVELCLALIRVCFAGFPACPPQEGPTRKIDGVLTHAGDI